MQIINLARYKTRLHKKKEAIAANGNTCTPNWPLGGISDATLVLNVYTVHSWTLGLNTGWKGEFESFLN